MKKFIFATVIIGLIMSPALVGAQYYDYSNQYSSYQYPYNYSSYNNGYGSVMGAYYQPQCNFTVNLSLGMTHPQVADLNRMLGSGYSPYFDQTTYNAVVNFQNQYAGEVLYPAGLVYATGFVGPLTRAKLNALCNGMYGNYSNYSMYSPYGYTGYNSNVLGASTYNPYGYNYNYGTNYTYPYNYNYSGN